MTNIYYQEQVLENIARKVLCGYDSALYYGSPAAVPIEEMIEAHGVSLEYQYLRKNGRILGKTIFDEGLEAVYDMENQEYTLFPVRAGTILIDASLCEEDASTGRLRFTCAHELAHWILHKKLYTGTGRSAAMITEQSETTLILMPIAQIKRCFYQLRGGRQDGQLIDDMANVFQVSRQAMRIRLTNHRLL